MILGSQCCRVSMDSDAASACAWQMQFGWVCVLGGWVGCVVVCRLCLCTRVGLRGVWETSRSLLRVLCADVLAHWGGVGLCPVAMALVRHRRRWCDDVINPVGRAALKSAREEVCAPIFLCAGCLRCACHVCVLRFAGW